MVAKLDRRRRELDNSRKIELNSDATPKKGAERFNEQLRSSRRNWRRRGNIADALALFLESVSQEAEYAASKKQTPPVHG